MVEANSTPFSQGDSIGQYKVRRDGVLTFTFNVESAIAAKWSEPRSPRSMTKNI